MTILFLRRRNLGKKSCNGIASNMRVGSDLFNGTEGALVVRNDHMQLADFSYRTTVVRWGCTDTLPVHRMAVNEIINKANSIHLVNNKLEFRRILNEQELCPETWFDEGTFGDDTFPWGYPAHYTGDIKYIARKQRHAQGKDLVFGCPATVAGALISWGEGYISKFINKVAEYRVMVFQGRVCWVAKKTPGNPEDIAWNVARGGRFDNVSFNQWPLKVIKYAIKAFNLSGLDFGGVDVMVDADGKPYVLEINSAPSQTSPYRQLCMAKCFDWVMEYNSKEPIPIVERLGDWKKFVHPAISERAILN